MSLIHLKYGEKDVLTEKFVPFNPFLVVLCSRERSPLILSYPSRAIFVASVATPPARLKPRFAIDAKQQIANGPFQLPHDSRIAQLCHFLCWFSRLGDGVSS